MPSDHPDMGTAGDLWAPVDKLLRLSVAVPVESMDGLPRTVAPSRNWTFPVAGTPFAASVLGETFAVSVTLLPKWRWRKR